MLVDSFLGNISVSHGSMIGDSIRCFLIDNLKLSGHSRGRGVMILCIALVIAYVMLASYFTRMIMCLRIWWTDISLAEA